VPVMTTRTEEGEGFTLVELMIVVSILGVLASLAIYGVARYLKHAKTAEATRVLGAIETGSRQQFQRETLYNGSTLLYVHTFCPDTTQVPAAVPQAMKVLAPPSDWNDVGWACLKFSMNEPQFYSYRATTNSATGTAANYTATANGDLDGNGTKSTFRLNGHGGQFGDAVRDSLVAINEDE
jgi:type IV pilus assembly protein PilA